MPDQKEINMEIINLIVARLKTIPSDASLSIGGDEQNTMTQEDIIKEVREQSVIGKQIIESQLFFLRSLKDLPVEINA
ncbi:MAG: hypothetical protein AAB629_02680 [Patescibacteria group bacterium]